MMDVKTQHIDVFEFDVSDSFVIDNSAKADWAVSAIMNEYAQADVFEEACDLMIEELKAKKANRRCEADNKTAGLKDLLLRWMDTIPTKKAKNSDSIKLPSGTLRRVYANQTYEPVREKLIEKYSNTEFVKNKPDFVWGEFKKNLKIVDGQAIDTKTGEVLGDEYVKIIDTPIKIEVK